MGAVCEDSGIFPGGLVGEAVGERYVCRVYWIYTLE